MMKTHRWLWMIAALAVPAGYGCVDDNSGPTHITDRSAIQVNLDFPLANLPGGDVVNNAGAVALDTATYPTDLFGRATGSAWDTWPSPRYSNTYDLATDYGRKSETAGRHWIFKLVPDDSRYPFLMENSLWADNYNANADHMRWRSPASSYGPDCLPAGTPCWAYQSDYDYLGPSDSWFAVGLVRYATKVAGLVDHLEILTKNGVVTEPDTLIPLGGTLLGYPDIQSDHWQYSGDDCLPMLADANPFIMGHFKTGPTVDPKDAGADFDGETDADYSICSNGVWSDSDVLTGQQPFADNDFTTFDLPAYNYLVWWAYDKDTGEIFWDQPWTRFQIGNDIDLNGDPIPHGFAPFPTAPGRELSDFDSYAEFLADSRVAGGALDLELTLYSLSELASGVEYQVWLFDDVESATARIDFTYTQQWPDTVGFDPLGLPIIEWNDVSAPATVSGFDGVVGNRHVIYASDAELASAGIVLNSFTHVVITIGANDADPNTAPAPVFYRFTEQNGTRDNLWDNAPVLAANTTIFGFIPELAQDDVGWTGFGSGLSQFLNEEGFSVGLERMARPPLGYYYAVWVKDNETGAYAGLGEITSPPPEFVPLYDADISTGDWVTSGEILAAGKWALWNEEPLSSFTHCITSQVTDACTVVVTLEPKDGDHNVMSESIAFIGAVPKDLDRMPKEETSR
jgi:hypothetical protein